MAKVNKYTTKFNNKINGMNIYEIRNMLDYSIRDLEKRITIVNYICDNYLDDWMSEFVDEYYNPILGSTGEASVGKPLSEEHNVFHVVEMFANYLIFCPDEQPSDVKKERQLSSRKRKETSDEVLGCATRFSASDEKNATDDKLKRDSTFVDENGILVEKNTRNYKKAIKQVITKKDIRDIPEIRAYEKLKSRVDDVFSMTAQQIDYVFEGDANTYVKKLVANPKNKGRLLGSINQDELWVKDFVRRTIYFKSPLQDSGHYDEKFIDLSNKNHVRNLLKVKDKGLFVWYGYSKRSLNNLINSMNFDSVDMKIIRAMEFLGESSETKMAEYIGMTRQTFQKRVSTIIKRINSHYIAEKYDWYYMNFAKGEYKKCGSCGEYKLIKFFGANNSTNDNYTNTCKYCRNRFI